MKNAVLIALVSTATYAATASPADTKPRKTPSVALPEEYHADKFRNIDSVCDNHSDPSEASFCRHSLKQFEKEWPLAFKGDYQAQRNVAFCLGSGKDGLGGRCGYGIPARKSLSCAWRMIILASGSPRVDDTDISNFKIDCSKLSETEKAVADAQFERLSTILKKAR